MVWVVVASSLNIAGEGTLHKGEIGEGATKEGMIF
jgi:hypothetical protein